MSTCGRLLATSAAGLDAFHDAPPGISVDGAKLYVMIEHVRELPQPLDAFALAC
ncbi:hypothetical protein BH11PSE14_BH11PSE14_01480 [soil metagenome]